MDHAMNIRQSLIGSASSKTTNEISVDATIKRLASGLEAKRVRAKKILGERWVLHPACDHGKNAHHNPAFKGSAVLSMYLHLSGAVSEGRV